MESKEKRFGIWNSVDKRFVFGINEPSYQKAIRAFKRKVGNLSYCYRYMPREIPDGFENPPNPIWGKMNRS